MALDATVLAQIRDHVGSTPSDDDIEAIYTRDDIGTADLAALSILRRRLADFRASYSEFAVEGDARWKADKNIDALTAQIAVLETACGVVTSSTLTAGQLVRVQGR